MRIVALLLTALTLAGQPARRAVSDAEVRKVHKAALVLDTHNDVTGRTVTGFDIGSDAGTGHTDIRRYRAGGFGAQFFAVYVAGRYMEGNHAAHRALEMIDTVRRDIVEKYPRDFELARTAADAARIRKKGKIAAYMGIEGGHAIEDSPRLLRTFYDLGVRYMTLTHAVSHTWAGSSGDLEGRKKGLTPLGREIVREMNRLGMMVDISHVSDATFWDALDASKSPLIASHSSCRALANVPRNMTDEMIVALAKKGGVVQVNFACGFVKVTPRGGPRPTLDDAVAHIDHIVKIAGIDAVGVGADYDGVSCVPTGLEDVSKMPALTRALLERGYSAKDIRKIYGENLLRVMRANEKNAASGLR